MQLQRSTVLGWIILLPFFWVFSGLMVFRGGDKTMVAIALIAIIASLIHQGVSSVKRNIREKGMWLLLLVVVYSVWSKQHHGGSSREERALICGVLYLLFLPRELVTKKLLQGLVALGAVIALVSSYYFSEYLQLPRGAWPVNAIPRGAMSAAIASLALVFLVHAQHKREKVIFALVFCIAVLAIVINQSRGIWLALLCSSIIILSMNLKRSQINGWSLLAVAVTLAFGVAAIQPKIQQISDRTSWEISQMERGHTDTSIGLRLQLWRAAAQNMRVNPVFGMGDGHQEELDKLAQKEYISSKTATFSHYHNQYLDRLVKNGIVGFALLLGLLCYPLIVSAQGMHRQMAIGVVLVYVVAGLTDVPLNHGGPLLMYLLIMLTLKARESEK